jgi:hypothetical protein
MQRIRQYLLPALLAILSLVSLAALPIGSVAHASSSNTTCPTGEESFGHFCELVISAPESVAVGQLFTVQVAVTTDGTTVAKSDFCASKVAITLAVTDNDSTLFYSANASAGIATFTIGVSSPGFHSMTASANVPEGTPPPCGDYFYSSDSADFQAVQLVPADQPIAPCPNDVSCLQVISTTGTAATLYANDGSFTASFGPLPAQQCGGGGPPDPNGVLTFGYGGSSPNVTLIFALDPAVVTKGIGRYNVCWQSTIPFTPAGGGAPVTVGYLPNCSNHAAAPCVLFRTGAQHDAAFIGVLAPPVDPIAYVE